MNFERLIFYLFNYVYFHVYVLHYLIIAPLSSSLDEPFIKYFNRSSFLNFLALQCGQSYALREALLANALDIGDFHLVDLPQLLHLREFPFQLLQLGVDGFVELVFDFLPCLFGEAL